MLILGVATCLFRYFGDGPLWPYEGVEPNDCSAWWTNLLYVNNFFQMDNKCVGHAWYLANDMQFYVVVPIFLVLLWL